MREPGFELTLPGETEMTFFPLSVDATTSKAMQIIDRCTALPLDEFWDAMEDPRQRARGPILMAMLGLSIRAARPTWTVERIMDIVGEADWTNVDLVAGDDTEEAVEGDEDPLPVSEDESNSALPSNESSPSSTPQEASTTPPYSAPSSATPA
jgi:hypothetical protein